jgi:SHAQKYF class myb-like DNA-binding protein
MLIYFLLRTMATSDFIMHSVYQIQQDIVLVSLHTCAELHELLGVPWTEEEHRTFLIGLQKLGKGDWRGISRNFVKTRTPTQVASHAQKYFLRRNNLNKRRRRSSLFDMSPNTVCISNQSTLPLTTGKCFGKYVRVNIYSGGCKLCTLL